MKSWKQYYCGMWTEQKQDFPYWKKRKRKKKRAVRVLPSGRSYRNQTEAEEESRQAGWRRLPFPFVLISMLQFGPVAFWVPERQPYWRQRKLRVSISHLGKRTRSLTAKANDPIAHLSCLHHLLQRWCTVRW